MHFLTARFLLLGFTGLAAFAEPTPQNIAWTGWFSDNACAAPRVKNGYITATNPECAKKCIEKGEAAVFISEQAKDLFKISGYTGAVEDLGYHVEVKGTVDPSSRTLSIKSVKRLEYQGASCARPPLKRS